jgi:hypothetical protein
VTPRGPSLRGLRANLCCNRCICTLSDTAFVSPRATAVQNWRIPFDVRTVVSFRRFGIPQGGAHRRVNTGRWEFAQPKIINRREISYA